MIFIWEFSNLWNSKIFIQQRFIFYNYPLSISIFVLRIDKYHSTEIHFEGFHFFIFARPWCRQCDSKQFVKWTNFWDPFDWDFPFSNWKLTNIIHQWFIFAQWNNNIFSITVVNVTMILMPHMLWDLIFYMICKWEFSDLLNSKIFIQQRFIFNNYPLSISIFVLRIDKYHSTEIHFEVFHFFYFCSSLM